MKIHKLLRTMIVIALVTGVSLSHARPRYDPYGDPPNIPEPPIRTVSLPNTEWRLEGINPENGSISSQGMQKMTLSFSSNGGISGDTGCNEFWSSYQTMVSKGMLTIGEIDMTKVGCRNHSDERIFLNTLEKTKYYKYESNLLKLEDSNHRFLMKFSKNR
jgi:heat shock protein HslJ